MSECTFGTSALRHCGPAEGLAAIAAARERGINAFEIDAGDGDAVGLLGTALNGEAGRDAHVFARATSLVPFPLPSPHVPAHRAYPGRHLRAEAEALLARLGAERLALLQLHAWCPEWLHEGDWLDTLERLRDEGKIAGFGVSLFDHDAEAGLEAVASDRIDSVQVMVNVFDPAATTSLLPLCRTHDIAVIARSPLYYGAFAGPRDYPHGDWRSAYFFDAHRRETGERVARLAREAAPLLETALRFGLSHPAVSTMAVGMRSRAQVEANVQAIAHGPLDAVTLALLARHAWLT